MSRLEKPGALCGEMALTTCVFFSALVVGFDWGAYLQDHGCKAVSVSSFKHVSPPSLPRLLHPHVLQPSCGPRATERGSGGGGRRSSLIPPEGEAAPQAPPEWWSNLEVPFQGGSENPHEQERVSTMRKCNAVCTDAFVVQTRKVIPLGADHVMLLFQ